MLTLKSVKVKYKINENKYCLTALVVSNSLASNVSLKYFSILKTKSRGLQDEK